MFLRATKRFKDGTVHDYWSMVENVRVGRRVFRIARGEAEPPKAVARGVRQALYLGELNDSQREEWQRAIEAFDEKGNVRQPKLFPEDRAPETDDGRVVRIRMDRLTVRNVRNRGEAWLGLDGFCTPRFGPSRKGTDWLALMKAIVLTPDGFPLAYEVMPGNTSDKETQMPFIQRLEEKYGKIGSLWLMDRGVPTEKTLREMRESGYRYLVGAPRGEDGRRRHADDRRADRHLATLCRTEAGSGDSAGSTRTDVARPAPAEDFTSSSIRASPMGQNQKNQ